MRASSRSTRRKSRQRSLPLWPVPSTWPLLKSRAYWLVTPAFSAAASLRRDERVPRTNRTSAGAVGALRKAAYDRTIGSPELNSTLASTREEMRESYSCGRCLYPLAGSLPR